jgi:hypothetical protein
MDPHLQESILQVFTETQQWTQQFIVEDSGKLVDLASATIQQASTTPENAQNQPPSYPHRSVYRFDSTKYKAVHDTKAITDTKLPTPQNPRTLPRQQHPQRNHLDSSYFLRSNHTITMSILLHFLTWINVMGIRPFSCW